MTKNQKTESPCIEWLKKEYPRGIDLIYIDYNDNLNNDKSQLQNILKTGYEEDMDWICDSEHQTMHEVFENYKNELNLEEIPENDIEEMRDWMYEHRTDTPIEDLLKNTNDVLCFIETIDESYEDKSNLKKIIKKYAKTDKEKEEIEYVINEQFYQAPVSFYFKLNVKDIYKVLHNNNNKNISIDGAYFSTIDRGQGSNWLGNNGIFRLTLKKEDFINNFYLDQAEGNGYGWNEIAGQCDYDEAGIVTGIIKNAIKVKTSTSTEMMREKTLSDNWKKTKKCTYGDKNYNRHIGPKTYSNNFPCGTKCEACGTFWID